MAIDGRGRADGEVARYLQQAGWPGCHGHLVPFPDERGKGPRSKKVTHGCKPESCQLIVWSTGPLPQHAGAGNVRIVYQATLHYNRAWAEDLYGKLPLRVADGVPSTGESSTLNWQLATGRA